jgi:hypothetical protein
MKVIAIDVDDTLNNYSEVLRSADFPYNNTYPVSADKFAEYLEMVRAEKADKDDLLNPEFSFVRQTINGRCYELAAARADAVDFLQWLGNDGWRIVICTQRDLRRTEQPTRKWLGDNAIPFDDLFIAVDKLGFCKDWGIKYLVDDHLYSVRFADDYGVNVFYPIMAKHEGSESRLAKGFETFDQVRQWIQELN